MNSYQTEEARWHAVASRDTAANGAFVFGVLTTGIYCRPGCASRQPRREHVRFFASSAEAEQAGLRACKRCTPNSATASERTAELVARACAHIAEAEHAPSLAELAAEAGMSPFHFQRLFRRSVGVSPKQYALAQRQQRATHTLHSAPTVTEALFDAGYTSSSQFYGATTMTLGMPATTYRNGAAGQQIALAAAPCFLGWVLVAATERGICAIELGDSAAELEQRVRARFPQAEFTSDTPELATALAGVLALLDRPASGLELPLDIQGTAFQQRVWAALRQIPAGETVSYTQLAERMGQPNAARAVASACAANTLAVAIPCHRVIGSSGKLSGYRWGLERKQALLDRETQA